MAAGSAKVPDWAEPDGFEGMAHMTAFGDASTEQLEGRDVRAKLKVLESGLKASEDLAEDLDGSFPGSPEVLSYIRSALVLVSGALAAYLLVLILSAVVAGDPGSPLLS